MPHLSNRQALDLFVERLLTRSKLDQEEQGAIASLPVVRTEVAAHRDTVRLGERTDHACLVEAAWLHVSARPRPARASFSRSTCRARWWICTP